MESDVDAHPIPEPLQMEPAASPLPGGTVEGPAAVVLGDAGERPPAIPDAPPPASPEALSGAAPAPIARQGETAPKGPASVTFLVAITLASLAADLATKAWAKAHLSGFEPKGHALRRLEVWKGHIEFIFAQNPGGAWSFLRNLPDSLRRPFFLVVSAGAIVFIITIYQRVHRDQWAMKLGLPLALGGAGGNLVNRIRYGWVVDFIDFSMRWGGRNHHWPTFNVADVAIVVGVGLMAIDMLRTRGLHGHDGHVEDVGSAPKPPAAVSPISS